MEKVFEIFETWFKMQWEFADNWANIQKDIIDNLIESSKRFREPILKGGTAQESLPGRQVLDFYNAWFGMMVSSSRAFTDRVIEIQDTWKASVLKQADAGREFLGSISKAREK
jgi:hypothetical protein